MTGILGHLALWLGIGGIGSALVSFIKSLLGRGRTSERVELMVEGTDGRPVKTVVIEGVDNAWADKLIEQLEKGTKGDTSGPAISDPS
jgi:hypothetical protein